MKSPRFPSPGDILVLYRKDESGALAKILRNPTLARTLLLNAFLNHRVSSHGQILQTGASEGGTWPEKRFDDACAVRCKINSARGLDSQKS